MEKLWNNNYSRCIHSDFKIFKNFVTENKIIAVCKNNFDTFYEIKNNFDNCIHENDQMYTINMTNQTLHDHISCYIDIDGNKIFTSHSYIDQSYINQVKKHLKLWCKYRKLKFKLFESWYYPKRVIGIQINDKLIKNIILKENIK